MGIMRLIKLIQPIVTLNSLISSYILRWKMRQIDEDHPLLTISEAAQNLRLSKNTLNNWLSQGKLKRVKIGRRTFVSRQQVNQLLEDALKL